MPLLAAAFVWRTRTAPEKGGPVNTYVNDDMATAIAAVEEILAGQPATSTDRPPLHDPSHLLPLVDDGGGGGQQGC